MRGKGTGLPGRRFPARTRAEQERRDAAAERVRKKQRELYEKGQQLSEDIRTGKVPARKEDR